MGKVLCVLYHRVIPYKEDAFGIKVSPDHFKQQMEFLISNYRIIPFDSDWNEVDGNAVAITFDDGYMDNYLYAYPIIKEYRIPVTFFVSTGNIDSNKEYWWDDLQRLCCERIHKNDYFDLRTSVFDYRFPSRTDEQLRDMMYSIRHILRREDNKTVWRNIFDDLYKWSGCGCEGRKCNYSMTKEQIVEMSRNEFISFGGHTVTHRSLGSLPNDELFYECFKSVSDLAKIIGKGVNCFSYPFGGGGDYREDVFRVLNECKVLKAATTHSQVVSENCYNYEVPRVTIKDNSDIGEILGRMFNV